MDDIVHYMNARVYQQLSTPCAFSFRHKIQFIYFPIYLLLEACAHDLRFALPESTTAQASNAAQVRSQKAPDFQLF